MAKIIIDRYNNNNNNSNDTIAEYPKWTWTIINTKPKTRPGTIVELPNKPSNPQPSTPSTPSNPTTPSNPEPSKPTNPNQQNQQLQLQVHPKFLDYRI